MAYGLVLMKRKDYLIRALKSSYRLRIASVSLKISSATSFPGRTSFLTASQTAWKSCSEMDTCRPSSRVMYLAMIPGVFAFNFGLEREVCLLSQDNMVDEGDVQTSQSLAEGVRRPDVVMPGFGLS